jgi:hypothetical protein
MNHGDHPRHGRLIGRIHPRAPSRTVPPHAPAYAGASTPYASYTAIPHGLSCLPKQHLLCPTKQSLPCLAKQGCNAFSC